MSDTFWTAFFANLPQIIGALVIGIPVMMTAWMTWRNGQRDKIGREAGSMDRAAIAKAIGVPDSELHQQTQAIVLQSAHSAPAALGPK